MQDKPLHVSKNELSKIRRQLSETGALPDVYGGDGRHAKHIDTLIRRYPALAPSRLDIEAASLAVTAMHLRGGKLLLCGNGGSAADCEHISGELLKSFLISRPPLPEDLKGLDPGVKSRLQRGIAAVPLPSFSSLLTAFGNDVDPGLSFAQLVYALGREGDAVMGISTSGNAENVVRALETASSMGLFTIALTGRGGGALGRIAGITIAVPESETFKVQELHLPVYHAICAQVEEWIFGTVTGTGEGEEE